MEARGSTSGERKTITALFADLKGSTALIEDLDPEDARAIIDPLLKLMMDAVHRYEGYVAQSLGDGIFALFGAPIAHEDHPQRALSAALLMQEQGKQYAETLRREKGINVQIRVGVNTGEVVVRSIRKDDLHTDYVPVGHSINLAARMESLATPGSIVVSEHTHRLAEGYFEFESHGAVHIKGVSDPLDIYTVRGIGPLRTRLQVAARRGLIRFVGRQAELGQMQRTLERVKARSGQIVSVLGEPGVGKSRLFHEFKRSAQKGCLILETFSVSHGKAYPYLPLIELLKDYFHITVQDDEQTRREKIAGRVLTLDRNLEDILPYVSALLGIPEPVSPLQRLDPRIRRQRTFDALKRLLVRESLKQPVLLIFEDLHWVDAETEAFLDALSESLATTRILLLVNYRPEYRHGWGAKTYYTQLRLDPLGREEAQELLAMLLEEKGEAQRTAPLLQFILEKTEGNPFFMEEIVQSLLDQRTSQVSDSREMPRLVSAQSLNLPPTVQGILAARLDRLSLEEKNLLQTLAVIGKEFSFNLVKQVVNKSEPELQSSLASLRSAEFIYEQPAFPEVEYTFKHALTQEVAYNSLLLEHRKVLHERVAQAIEMLSSSRLEDYYSELAQHYSRSDNTQKGIEYLQLAGQQSAQRSAHTEAVNHFTTALELLKALPDTAERAHQELTLQIALAAALQAIKGPAAPEVERAYTRARALCRPEETSQLFAVLRGLWVLHHVRAELPTARELGEQLLSMAERTQDTAFLLEAHRALGSTLLWQGEFSLARVHLERGGTIYDSRQHHSLAFLHGGADPGVSCLCDAARVLWFLGYPAQALERSQAALALAEALSDLFSVGYALVFAAGLHQLRREGWAAQQRAEAGIALAREQEFTPLIAAGTIRRGWALAEQGQVEEGLAQMHQGLATRGAARAALAQPYFLVLQAEVYGKVGQREHALSLLTEALAVINRTGERRLEAEVHRLKGTLTLQKFGVQGSEFEAPSPQPLTPNTQAEMEREAEECFLRAIEIARHQQAKSLELRAVMSLSRLWQQQGKKEEARRRLAEIYNWFTEGFDTVDLQEAKAFLAELR